MTNNQIIKFKKNLILKRIIFLAMLLVTFYIVFNFSAQDGEESGNLSEKVTTLIVNIFSKVKNMDENTKIHYIAKLHPIVRKLAHFSLYTIIGFSVMGFFCTFNIQNKYKVLWSTLIGISYAGLDEFHQSFTPGRGPSIKDVAIDSSGVLTGIFIMVLLIILLESIANWLKK